MAKEYFPGVDVLKGVLILLVVFGHVLQGNVDEETAGVAAGAGSPVARASKPISLQADGGGRGDTASGTAESAAQSPLRYVIYGFHMPMFLGISGFLLTAGSLGSLSFGQLVRKYFFRMLLPWAVALVLYTIADHWSVIRSGGATRATIAGWILYPDYHLWFVSSLFIMIVLLWAIVKLKISPLVVLGAATVFTISWMLVFKGNAMADPKALHWMGEKRTWTFFSFFLMGYCARNYRLPALPAAVVLALAAGALALRVAGFYCVTNLYVRAMIFIFLNAVLILGALPVLARMNWRGVAWIAWIGVNSLFVYLWHPFVKLATHEWLLPRVSLPQYYVLTVALMAVVLAVIYLIASRVRPLRAVFMGIAPPSPQAQ